MYLIGRDYMLEKKSSPYHDILHKNTGKLLAPVARAPKEALKAMVQARWPNCKEMLAIAMYVNDHSVDVSDMLLLPETVEVQTSTGEAGSSSDLAGLDSLFGTNAGAKTKKRKTDAKKAAKKKWAWKSDPNDPAAKVGAINKALGPPEDELKKFRSALDLGGEDTEHSVSDKWTVVILPSIPPFGESDLEDAISDDPRLPMMLAICQKHMDMRGVAMIGEELEGDVREKYASGGSHDAAVKEFNTLMHDELHIRHGIHKDDKGSVLPFKTNGKNAILLRKDWAQNQKLAELEGCRRAGGYKSKYFQALFKLHAAVCPASEKLRSLPEFADATTHFVKAMNVAAKMKPAESDYDDFDWHGRWFCTKWRLLQCSLKGYGFHLWASCSFILRLRGSLAAYDQSAVEANNERANRFLQQIPKGAGGRYSNEVNAEGVEARAAEYAARRRKLKSLCRAMYEFSTEETMNTKYALFHKGNLKRSTETSLTDDYQQID